MTHSTRYACLTTAICLFANSAIAEDVPKADPKFDLDGDGYVNLGEELNLYLAHKYDPVLATYDTNLNGRLDPSEVANRRAAQSEQNRDRIFLEQDDLERDIGAGEGLPLARPAPTVSESDWTRSFRLRTSFSDPSVLSKTPDAPQVLAANPFRLSYSRDYLNDTEDQGLKGAAFFEWRNRPKGDGSLQIQAYSLGVEIEQSRAGDSTTTDTISARGGGAWLFQNQAQDAFVRSHFVTANTGWITDSSGDLSVLSTQVRYQPLLQLPGFAGNSAWIGKLQYSVTPTLTADYQRVVDDGGQPQFMETDEALFVGAAIGATFGVDTKMLAPLSARLKYQVWDDVSSNADQREYFEAELGWTLSETGRTQFLLTYVNGETPTSLDVEEIRLGLGIAF